MDIKVERHHEWALIILFMTSIIKQKGLIMCCMSGDLSAVSKFKLFNFILCSASTLAGTVSTIMTAPVDMIKTRLMLQRESKSAGSYKNGFHCAYQVNLFFASYLG